MKLAIQVEGHPASSSAAGSAYQFIKAALAKGHEILVVFFYYDGVFTGIAPESGDPDESPSALQWGTLAKDAQLQLVVCSAALERRGLLEGVSTSTTAGGRTHLAAGFHVGGLSLWVDACLRCDRHITFAG